MKFDSHLRPATQTLWVFSYGGKTKDGGQPPFENRYIAVSQPKSNPVSMKFCKQQQILNWMNVT